MDGRREPAADRAAARERARAAEWLGLACALALVLAAAAGCSRGGREAETAAGPAADRVAPAAEASLAPQSVAAIRRFCGDCHAVPRPGSFPREAWPKEVRQGYDLYLASGRSDLVRPVERDALRYFTAGAPEKLVVPRAAEQDEPPAPVRFLAEQLPETLRRGDPAIAQVVATRDAILTTDMRHGDVSRWRRGPDGWSMETIARSPHPCRVIAVTTAAAATEAAPRGPGPLPAGGLLLADLGSFLPEDHDRGGVFAIDVAAGDALPAADRATPPPPRPLVQKLSRTVEAHAFDADDDGHDDLLVAEFGWLSTGALRLLLSGPGAVPEEAAGGVRPAVAAGFREVVLDRRHGVLGVRLADLDGDGRRDIVAAFAQEHETVDVWWNRGGGRFDHERILALPDPSYGSSGFDVADLDGDGRPDLLHVNGDTMDSGLAKPYHAIRGIKNRGPAGFVVEEIATLVGVCQATAVDLDLDGDADIVAAALHPGAVLEPPGTFDALLWLERTADGGYRRHSIERDRCDHAAFAIADVDGDGRPDVVAGCWRAEEDGTPRPPLTVFLNRRAE